MVDSNNLSGKVTLDTTDYKTGVAELSRQVKIIETGFKAAAAGMDDWSKTSEGVETHLKTLTTVIGLQQQKISLLTAEYQKVVAAKGADSAEAEKLQIRINNETAALNKNQLALKNDTQSLKDIKDGTVKTGEATQTLSMRFTEFNSALSLIKQGLDAANKIYAATVGKSLELAGSIREISAATGMSSEDTSRAIQVFDDYGIKADQLRTILARTTKEGFQASIEGIAGLANKIQSIADPTERATELNDLFGKSWFKVVELLGKGGDAFQQAAAGINANLVLTEAQVAAARKLEMQLDDLNDAWNAFSVGLGSTFIPFMIDALTLSAKNAEKQRVLAESNQYLARMYISLAAATQINNLAKTDAAAAEKLLNEELQKNPTYVAEQKAALEANNEALREQYRAQQDNTRAAAEALALSGLSSIDMNTHTGYIDAENQAMQRAIDLKNYDAQAAKDLQAADENLAGAVSNLAGAQNQLQTDTQKLNDELGGMTVSAIDKVKQSYDSQLAATKIADAAFGTHAALTMEKTKDVQDATAAFYNSPQAESDKAAYLARLDAVKAKYAETDASIEADKQKVIELQKTIDALTGKEIQIIIKTYHEDIQGAPGTGDNPGKPVDTTKQPDKVWHPGYRRPDGTWVDGYWAAHGLDTIIPPGFPNDSAVVHVSSGERVTVIPANQVRLAGGGPGKSGATITQTFNTNDPISTHMVLEQARRDKLAAIEGRL